MAKEPWPSLSEITASTLALITTFGYFWVFRQVFKGMPPEGLARDLANQMLGSLTTVWITVMAFYFGGSLMRGKGQGTGAGIVSIGRGGDPDTTHTAVIVDQQPAQQTQTDSDSTGAGK